LDEMKLRLVGSSMSARLLSGERVPLSRARVDELEVGDVVAFVATNGEVVAHRLTRFERGTDQPRFWTRGDGAAEPDEPFEAEALVGRVSRDGALGRAIVRWPRLALPLGAALRVRRAWDLPSALLAAVIALTIQLVRISRRR
jgi:hypothetical protein